MRKKLLAYCVLAVLLFSIGCKQKARQINWNVTLNNEDKSPYGSYIAYESLKYYFPGVKIEALSPGFRYGSIDDNMKYGGTSLMVLNGLSLRVSDDELQQLIGFATAGNEILIFSNTLDPKLEDYLHCYKQTAPYPDHSEETELSTFSKADITKGCVSLESNPDKYYCYDGRTVKSWFEIKDSGLATTQVIDTIAADIYEQLSKAAEDDDTIAAEPQTETLENLYAEEETEGNNEDTVALYPPEILGRVKTMPNMVRYEIGEGHITLHASPLVMSNYFLLQGGNAEYLTGIWNTLPGDISHIYWNSYYRHRAEHSDFGILWRNPATRWALWLSIITLALYVLLELKRRQQPIPIVKPLENTSVSFVETVGRLYYNKGNHHNLAEKMAQHFLEWVRTHYYLNTNHLNDTFIQSLANKSGLPVEVAANMVEMIHEIRLGSITIDEPYLYHLNNTIQRFYKNQHK